MTLLSENVAMKPKTGIASANLSSEPVYSKHNVKMAINRTLAAKKNNESGLDGYARSTVLVNASHRNQISNVRTIVSGSKNINIPNNELLRCKRKIHFISGQSYPGAQPASVARRNARERNRVKQVNNGFATLRSHIPPSVAAALTSEKSSPRNSTASKKLSKVETLKMAVEYIRSLQQMLEDHNNSLSEKKVTIDQNGYEKHFELDENFYSGSPENGNSVHLGDGTQQLPETPCRVFPKMEPIDSDYYSGHRQYLKSENEDVFIKNEIYQSKSEHFNQELHETLTSEFYAARSPLKSYYLSQEENDFKNQDQSTIVPLVSEKLSFGVEGVSDQSPQKADYKKRSRSPNLTVLNSVSANQIMQFSGQSFLRPQCRSSASLSPTVSEACPSPTPSHSSDHSSVHHGSIVSGSSVHLISGMSRLSTHIVPGDSLKNQLTSPTPRSASPKCLTPPRNLSPLSANTSSVVPLSSSPSNHSSYSISVDFQKGSPEGYENYDNVSPEDEELLDVISWWQQSH